jgi:hypothetical protein
MTMPDRIQITHAQPMTTPTTRAALTPDGIPPGPLSEDDLRQRWNVQADEFNQWESLDSCEQLAWAQALAIRADRHAAALKAEPEGQRPTDEDLYDLAAEFNGDPVPAMRRALEVWGNPLQGAPAPGENLSTPPAPVLGEVGELVELVELLQQEGGCYDPRTDVRATLFARAATLLNQQDADLAALRGVPVAVSERLRVVKAGIRAGYTLGHHHTVEGGWGDPDDVADDIAQETLDDIGLPPAPQCLIARMADELDRLQPLPAFPPITSHPLAIEARALLRRGSTIIPLPQAGKVALAGDRQSAESLQLAHDSCRLFGIKNGDCPDSEICWLDMLPCSHYENCATIPAPQAGDVEA